MRMLTNQGNFKKQKDAKGQGKQDRQDKQGDYLQTKAGNKLDLQTATITKTTLAFLTSHHFHLKPRALVIGT